MVSAAVELHPNGEFISNLSLTVVYLSFVSSSSSRTNGNTIKQVMSHTPHATHARMNSTPISLSLSVSPPPYHYISRLPLRVHPLHLDTTSSTLHSSEYILPYLTVH